MPAEPNRYIGMNKKFRNIDEKIYIENCRAHLNNRGHKLATGVLFDYLSGLINRLYQARNDLLVKSSSDYCYRRALPLSSGTQLYDIIS